MGQDSSKENYITIKVSYNSNWDFIIETTNGMPTVIYGQIGGTYQVHSISKGITEKKFDRLNHAQCSNVEGIITKNK